MKSVCKCSLDVYSLLFFPFLLVALLDFLLLCCAHVVLMLYPVSTRRRFDVHTTSITLKRRRTDVKTTSCVYWVLLHVLIKKNVYACMKQPCASYKCPADFQAHGLLSLIIMLVSFCYSFLHICLFVMLKVSTHREEEPCYSWLLICVCGVVDNNGKYLYSAYVYNTGSFVRLCVNMPMV